MVHYHEVELQTCVTVVCRSGTPCLGFLPSGSLSRRVSFTRESFPGDAGFAKRAFDMFIFLSHLFKFARRDLDAPRVIHGCNLDGYLFGFVMFPWARRRVFDVFDLWATMSGSRFLGILESFAIRTAHAVIAAASPVLEKANRKKGVLIGNATNSTLAKKAMAASRRFEHEQPGWYLLSGGTPKGSQVLALAEIVEESSSLRLVVAGDPPPDSGKSWSRVDWIGSQSWVDWLNLMADCGAVWAWQDIETLHYSKELSPNKYWEACFLNKPRVVNSLGQFEDRITHEPPVLELGDFRKNPSASVDSLTEALTSMGPREVCNNHFLVSQSLEAEENKRVEAVHQLGRLVA